MKELKFTKENLARHMNLCKKKCVDRKFIATTRRKRHGVDGDLFHVEGAGHFVLSEIVEFSGYDMVCNLFRNHYIEEGFSQPLEFMNEIIKIYGRMPETLYLHRLIQVYGVE